MSLKSVDIAENDRSAVAAAASCVPRAWECIVARQRNRALRGAKCVTRHWQDRDFLENFPRDLYTDPFLYFIAELLLALETVFVCNFAVIDRCYPLLL